MLAAAQSLLPTGSCNFVSNSIRATGTRRAETFSAIAAAQLHSCCAVQRAVLPDAALSHIPEPRPVLSARTQFSFAPSKWSLAGPARRAVYGFASIFFVILPPLAQTMASTEKANTCRGHSVASAELRGCVAHSKPAFSKGPQYP